MKNAKINYVAVGGFVIAMVAALIVSIAMLTGRTGATDEYYVEYGNVSGVKFGTQVVYEGYPIGQVEDITPGERDGRMVFRVDLSVNEGWRIPKDSVATVATSGLLSAVVIAIEAGESPVAHDPGAQIDGREASNIFAAMSTVAAEISDLARNDIKPLLAALRGTVGSVGSILDSDGKVLLQEITGIARDLSERAPKIVQNLETFTGRITDASEHVSKFVTAENTKKLQGMINNLDVTARNFTKLSKNMDQLAQTMNKLVTENEDDVAKSVEELRYVMDSMARHIDAINENVEATARNMNEFSRQIRANPSLLLGGEPPEDKGGE